MEGGDLVTGLGWEPLLRESSWEGEAGVPGAPVCSVRLVSEAVLARGGVERTGPMWRWAILMHPLLHSAGWVLAVPIRGTVGQILVRTIVIFCLNFFHWLGISRPCSPSSLSYSILNEQKLPLFPLSFSSILFSDPIRISSRPLRIL